MTTALQIARSGLDALDQRMKVISNNLANVNTTGFKRDRANFETLMYQSARTPGDPSGANDAYAVGLGTGTGVRVAGTERIHTQGSLTQTDNALDMAIEGSGFFQVTRPDGTTVTETVDAGFLAVTPGDAVSFGASTINWSQTGQNLANGTVVMVDAAQSMRVFAGGATHFLIDVVGYYAP